MTTIGMNNERDRENGSVAVELSGSDASLAVLSAPSARGPIQDLEPVMSALRPLVEQATTTLLPPVGAFFKERCIARPDLDICEVWIGVSNVSLRHGIQVQVLLGRSSCGYNERISDFAAEVDIEATRRFGDRAMIEVHEATSPLDPRNSGGWEPSEVQQLLSQSWMRFFPR